jgi:hypothetical protein
VADVAQQLGVPICPVTDVESLLERCINANWINN